MVDTQKLKEAFHDDLAWLEKTRDDLRLQAQQVKAETTKELEQLDRLWERVQDELRRTSDQVQLPAKELGQATRSLIDELRRGYERIMGELKHPRG